jgi:hypothetical protein
VSSLSGEHITWASEVGRDLQDTAVVVGGGMQVEPGEDAAPMSLNSLGTEEQPLADGLVGPTLGHEGEHLTLPFTELLDGIREEGDAFGSSLA